MAEKWTTMDDLEQLSDDEMKQRWEDFNKQVKEEREKIEAELERRQLRIRENQ